MTFEKVLNYSLMLTRILAFFKSSMKHKLFKWMHVFFKSTNLCLVLKILDIFKTKIELKDIGMLHK